MAEYSKEELKLFIENNHECNINGLIEWIAMLLPQCDFDNYINNIRDEIEGGK